MPLSWKHFEYTEMMELLLNYRKSIVHYTFSQDSTTDVSLINELLCPHKFLPEADTDLNDINAQINNEILQL